MSLLALWILGTAALWLVVFAGFVYAVRARWMSRLDNGFLVQLIIGLAAIGLMAASIVGVWGYMAAAQILDQELVIEMRDIGQIVEAQVAAELDEVRQQMLSLGVSLADAKDRGASGADLKDRLASARSFATHYLQMRLVDAQGAVLAESSAVEAGEPVNRIALAFNQEAKPFVSEAYYSPTFKQQVLQMSLPVLDQAGKPRVMIGARFDLASQFASVIKGSKFNQSGYAVLVDGEGQIIAHPDVSRLDENIADYPAVQMARQTREAGALVAKNKAGVTKLFVYRAMKNPSTLAQQPWVLLTEVDRDEELAGLRKLRRELALGVALVLLGSLLIAQQVSVSMTRPLNALGALAKSIGGGDLTSRAAIGGRDVAGRLAGALNDMATGLQERDHVKEVFGRYIATQVSDKILSGQVNLGGDVRRVTILFSDIRNFTGMSEAMAPQQVVSFLNDYFSEMVDAVFEQGGVLDKFMGDGLMAVFGSISDDNAHPLQAVKAALRMKALLAKINGVRSVSGEEPIAIGIGIHTDEVIVGNIGSRKRLEYTVVGDGVNTTSRLQGLNKDFGTTILISETTYEAVKDQFECRQMPETHLRGKTKNLRCYEVISGKGSRPAATA
jgi:class 3 adenylate cyclase